VCCHHFSDGDHHVTPTLDPDFDKPEVGACRLVKPGDIPPRSNTTATVPCSQRHNAITVAVSRTKPGQDLDRKSVYDLTSSRCVQAGDRLSGLSGSSLAMSIITYSWFIPTPAERRAGARWLRCDLNAYTYAAKGRRITDIYDLPRLPLRGGQLPELLRLCVDQPHGDFLRVSCSKRHTYRAVSAFRYPTHGRAYPSSKRLDAIAEAGCRAALHPTGRFWWDFPSHEAWNAGHPWIPCLLPDSGTGV